MVFQLHTTLPVHLLCAQCQHSTIFVFGIMTAAGSCLLADVWISRGMDRTRLDISSPLL